MKTFKILHEEARRRSRTLGFFFWLGLPLSGLLYGLIFYGFFKGALGFHPARALEAAAWFGSLFAFITLMNYLNAYYDLGQIDAATLAQRLGAIPLRPRQNPEDRRLQNIVEEMCLASGQPLPTVMVLRLQEDINGFVIQDTEERTVLCVSAGALRYLNRAELSSLIGHEFGHLANDDVPVNLHLSAILYGYFTIAQWGMNGRIAISAGRDRLPVFFNLLRHDGEPTLLAVFLSTGGFLLYFYGKLLQSAYSRTRELMADNRALEFGRDRDALAMVFKKMLALRQLDIHHRSKHQEFAHLLFANDSDWFATHPPLEERLRRLGVRLDPAEIHQLARSLRHKFLADD